MAKRKKHPGRPTGTRGTFREVLDAVERERALGAAADDIQPGEFNDEDMAILRHPAGEIMQLAEWEIDLEDAKQCVASGADVFVNPDDIAFDVRGTDFYLSVQRWLIGDQARQINEIEAEDSEAAKYSRISLYKSESGGLVIHLTGHFRWPNGVDCPDT